jgi:hypothetical protein
MLRISGLVASYLRSDHGSVETLLEILDGHRFQASEAIFDTPWRGSSDVLAVFVTTALRIARAQGCVK